MACRVTRRVVLIGGHADGRIVELPNSAREWIVAIPPAIPADLFAEVDGGVVPVSRVLRHTYRPARLVQTGGASLLGTAFAPLPSTSLTFFTWDGRETT